MKTRVLFLMLAFAVAVGETLVAGDWTEWGGPGRTFVADSEGLANQWPEEGPKRIWSRELGDGYSAILAEGGRLYTMYRVEDQEAVIALAAATGETVWEHRYDSSPKEGHAQSFGAGPRATPMISGNRIFSVGVAGVMHCLNKSDGSVVWSQDLWGEEFNGNILMHGYSSSPIAYKKTVIALVGGEGGSIVAFDQKTGKVKWRKHDFENTYSSPKLMDVDGQQQLVTFMATELVGLDPASGELKWSYPYENQYKQNVNMPVMADKNHLFLSSTQTGARGLKLTNANGKTEVEEIWSTRKIQFYHVNSVRKGDWVYGSTGARAPAFMSAVNIRTGEIAWRERGFAKANVVAADGKLIILDEDGKLYLTTATPEGLTVHSQAEILEKAAWTSPTIIGNTMYVRDKKHILALDLG